MLSFTRLDTARTFRGLSTEEACTRLGLDIRQWQSFEADGAPVALAEQLTIALGFRQSFFYRLALSDASQARGAFRAKARVSSRTRQAARASSLIGTEVYHWVRAHFSLPALDVPDLSNETPQMAAQLLRSMWNLGTRPAPNLVQLCESRGISVAGLGLEDLLEETHEPVDAFSLWDDGRPYIFTARRRSPEGERFTLAHELGRLVMHPNDPTTPEAESEVDAFAAEFLIPHTACFEYLPYNPSLERLLEFKTAFRVSAIAAARRVHEVGRCSDWHYTELNRILTLRGFRSAEPGGRTFYERSRVFDTIAGNDKYSLHDMATELGLPTELARSFALQTRLSVV